MDEPNNPLIPSPDLAPSLARPLRRCRRRRRQRHGRPPRPRPRRPPRRRRRAAAARGAPRGARRRGSGGPAGSRWPPPWLGGFRCMMEGSGWGRSRGTQGNARPVGGDGPAAACATLYPHPPTQHPLGASPREHVAVVGLRPRGRHGVGLQLHGAARRGVQGDAAARQSPTWQLASATPGISTQSTPAGLRHPASLSPPRVHAPTISAASSLSGPSGSCRSASARRRTSARAAETARSHEAWRNSAAASP
jgi:hypothetical protein